MNRKKQKSGCDKELTITQNNVENIYVLCGGGISAVMFGLGTLYGLYKTGNLMDENNNLRKNILFQSTSGGCVSTLLLEYVLVNNLHTQKNWFEKYIIQPCHLMNGWLMATLYTLNTVKSGLIYKKFSSRLVGKCSDNIYKLLYQVIPKEILNGKRITFSNTSQFKYNYVLDNNVELPYFSNDFVDLNDLSVEQQILELISRVAIYSNVSYLSTGSTNDAAQVLNNDVIHIENYPNLKKIYYFTLRSYDVKTNTNSLKPFNMFYYIERVDDIQQFNYIKWLTAYCESNHIEFYPISLPNKYNPIEKFKCALYTHLVRKMHFENDFVSLGTNLGLYLENGLNEDVKHLLFLFGALEYMYILNQTTNTKYDVKTLELDSFYMDKLNHCEDIYFPSIFPFTLVK